MMTMETIPVQRRTYLAYSLNGAGSHYLSPLNITLDLAQPEQVGDWARSDANGTAAWVLRIPRAAAGRALWLQACQFQRKTVLVETTVN